VPLVAVGAMKDLIKFLVLIMLWLPLIRQTITNYSKILLNVHRILGIVENQRSERRKGLAELQWAVRARRAFGSHPSCGQHVVR